MAGRDDVIALLDSRGIEYTVAHHEAVFTISEMERTGIEDADRVAKNLFLRDEKKRAYFLVSIRHDRTANLKALRRILVSKPLSFASEDDLHSMLALSKGEVTPFGLLNDAEHRVTFVMDSYFSDGIIGVHPNDNRETVFLKAEDLTGLLSGRGTKVSVVDLDQ